MKAQPGPARDRCVAIIPAFNESPAIGKVVADTVRLTDGRARLFERVIVVDNGSTDGTAEIASANGACVVREPRRGYGAACLAGIAAAGDADVLVFIDGDASVELADTHQLLAALAAGADLVVGARRNAPAEAMSFPQRFGNRLATGLIRLIWRVPVSEVSDLGPFRAIRGAALQRLRMRDLSYGWTVEMQVKAIQQGLRVVEVPVSLRPRVGQSKISGTVRGVMGAGFGILTMIGRLWLAEKLFPQRTAPLPIERIAAADAAASMPVANK